MLTEWEWGRGNFHNEISQIICSAEGTFNLSYLRVLGGLKGYSKYLFYKMNRCIVFHLCFACAEHLCILLGWLRRARRGTDLIAKKVLHRARNVFPPGPSQWTKKLLECIFLIEGADILHTAMDFSLLLLHPPPLSPIDSSKKCLGGMQGHIKYTIHCLSSHLHRTRNNRYWAATLPHLHNSPACTLFPLPLLYYLLFSHTNALQISSPPTINVYIHLVISLRQ